GDRISGDTMIQQKNMSPIQAPSMRKIVRATIAAAFIASILLFVAILPAEYGIDPLRTGKAMGLTDLAKASEKGTIPTSTSKDAILIQPHIEGEAHGAPIMKNTFIGQPKSYKV